MSRAAHGSRERRGERALTFLAQVVVQWSGYRVRGVFGWAHADDLSLLDGGDHWPGVLAELERCGAADSHAASLPCVAEPARIHRITQAGMRRIAAVLREDAPVVRAPGPLDETVAVYVSQSARWALAALRERPGEWMSADGAAEPSRRWNREENRHGTMPYRHVWSRHLGELVTAGLAQSREQELGKRGPQPMLYRVSACGLTAPQLAWHGRDAEHPVYREHDGTPLLREPGLAANMFGSGH